MQVFKNEVFSAPTSLFALASLRHAARLACLAAASGAAGVAAAGVVGAGALLCAAVPGTSARGAEGAAANAPQIGNRQTAAATVEKRMFTLMESE
jgi:hypothetical protein